MLELLVLFVEFAVGVMQVAILFIECEIGFVKLAILSIENKIGVLKMAILLIEFVISFVEPAILTIEQIILSVEVVILRHELEILLLQHQLESSYRGDVDCAFDRLRRKCVRLVLQVRYHDLPNEVEDHRSSEAIAQGMRFKMIQHASPSLNLILCQLPPIPIAETHNTP